MHTIFTIFKRDVRNISTNWVAAIIIGGLIFLPSLYAWLNVYASSDPYSRTDKLPVAVVNEDNVAFLTSCAIIFIAFGALLKERINNVLINY